jgi:hypothetical protein
MTTLEAIKERPILFSAPMVRAILEGHKTQTRRIVKGVFQSESIDPRDGKTKLMDCTMESDGLPSALIWGPNDLCPYQDGMRLWVRETFVLEANDVVPAGRPCIEANGEWGKYAFPHYRADGYEPHIVDPDAALDAFDDRTRWKPSIFMPRWASRITLEITGVRVERLQEISDADKAAEGGTADQPFGTIWKKINTEHGIRWEDNPWVWVVEFKLITPET